MQNKQDLQQNIELVSTLKMITQAYEEISIMRMQKIRNSVLKTRDFLVQLSGVFYDTKQSHNRFLKLLINYDDVDRISPYALLPQNGKKLAVYLSANERMNGEIISKVFHSFADYIKEKEKTNEEYDILIVGRIGKELYLQRGDMPEKYTYLEIPDDNVKLEDMKNLVHQMIQYQEIDMFYGQFVNVINQEAATSNITGDKPFDSKLFKAQKEDPKRKFLYEPSIDDIYTFFETQIFSALLKHTIDESHLARYASRIKAMDESMANIDAKAKVLRAEERKLKKSTQNKKQNEAIAGFALW
jgi:F-type H+-transporting ATPase subunit gamma